jgi:radical SAM protein with 4Fe4S-binding SPASM domain
MKIRRHSTSYNFIGDSETGRTFRWGKNLKDNPSFAPHPELADISISNHCSKGCSFCYRNSTNNNSFMTLEEYSYVLDSLRHPKWGNVFQIALGGGEPLEHPDFIEIINITHSRNIVPNFTTNGDLITNTIAKELAEKIGAIAISCQNIDELENRKVEILSKYGIKTNLHFLLNADTLPQAIGILKGVYNKSLTKINAIIFLTYKPCGRANKSKTLSLNDDFLDFVTLIDNSQCNTKIGFDACFVPNLMKYTKVDTDYIDPCECAFFSVYIDEKMNVKPCSFTTDESESFNLKDYSFREIWDENFKDIRSSRTNNCKSDCKSKTECRGGCPYFNELNTCYL